MMAGLLCKLLNLATFFSSRYIHSKLESDINSKIPIMYCLFKTSTCYACQKLCDNSCFAADIYNARPSETTEQA